jgi:hypothetical protein
MNASPEDYLEQLIGVWWDGAMTTRKARRSQGGPYPDIYVSPEMYEMYAACLDNPSDGEDGVLMFEGARVMSDDRLTGIAVKLTTQRAGWQLGESL